jgi:toxin ParE1/3/4
MKVRFTRPALDDLQQIYNYISKDNPSAASRVVMRLIDRAMTLESAPYQGREADEPNARVLVVPRFRYFIFYMIEDDEVSITHIRHTSRRRRWDLDLSGARHSFSTSIPAPAKSLKPPPL